MTVIRLAAALMLAAPAAASVASWDLGRACYEAATFAQPTRDGLNLCTLALRNGVTGARDRGATLVNRGIIQMRARRIDAAIADFDAALALAPGLAEALVNKGIALIAAGREQEAVAVLTTGIAAAPALPMAYFMRAQANETIGATRAAYDDYRQAAALAPDWPDPVNELRRFTVVRRPTARG